MKTMVLEVEDVAVNLQSDDVFGRVLSCHVDVICQLRSAMVTARKRISTTGVDLTWELRTHSNKLLGSAFMDSDDLDEGTARVECLLLDKQALLLERASKDKSEYYRIGVAELLGFDQDDDFFVGGGAVSLRLL
jgi:hypothetical protein